MSRVASARLATGLMVIALLACAGGLALMAGSWNAQTPPIWGFRGFQYAIGLSFAVIGQRIALRVPGNSIGWLALAAAIVAGIQGAGFDYATLALYTGRDLPGGERAAWVGDWIWVLEIGMLMLTLFVFPDGRLLGRGWLAGPAVGLIGAALMVVGLACASSLVFVFALANPVGCGPFSEMAAGALGAGLVLFSGALLAGAVSLVLRYRRAGQELQLQLKWVAAASAVFGIAFAIQVPDMQDKPRQYLVSVGALTIPAAFGVAILRYRLYEIDTLINPRGRVRPAHGGPGRPVFGVDRSLPTHLRRADR